MIFVRGRSFARVRLMMRRMMLKLKTVANLPVIVLIRFSSYCGKFLDCLREDVTFPIVLPSSEQNTLFYIAARVASSQF